MVTVCILRPQFMYFLPDLPVLSKLVIRFTIIHNSTVWRAICFKLVIANVAGF